MLNNIVSSEIYLDLKNLLEFISFVVTIIGFISIFISVKQLRAEQTKALKEEKEREKDIEYKKKEKSIELLELFANSIIPQMDDYIEACNKEFSENFSSSEIDQEKMKMIKLLVKKECGAGYIFNQLEHICLNIYIGLVDEEIIYYPLQKLLIEFVHENMDVYKDLLTQAPYKYLTEVYNSWTSKERLDELKIKEKEIQKERERILNQQNNTK